MEYQCVQRRLLRRFRETSLRPRRVRLDHSSATRSLSLHPSTHGRRRCSPATESRCPGGYKPQGHRRLAKGPNERCPRTRPGVRAASQPTRLTPWWVVCHGSKSRTRGSGRPPGSDVEAGVVHDGERIHRWAEDVTALGSLPRTSLAYAIRRQTYALHMAGAPLVTYDPAAKKATAKRLDEHSVYLSLEGGGVESFSPVHREGDR